MSESLRNDGRIWVPRDADDARPPSQIPEDERDYYLERMYPSFGNLAPRDIASRAAKRAVDSGRGVGPLKNGVYLDFADAIGRVGQPVIEERYGNLFEMYERITDEDPYRAPMRIYPAPLHDGRVVGGLRAHDHRPRPVRRRRGQFLRPRRQPSRRRRSCRASPTGTTCFRRPWATTLRPGSGPGQCPPITLRSRPPSRRLEPGTTATWPSAGLGPSTGSTASSARSWDHCGMERTAEGLEKALGEIPALRGVPQGPARAGWSRCQPVAGEGRSRGRLLRAGGVDVPRRPRPQRELRRPLPGRVPDRGRRGGATTSTTPTWPRGNGRVNPTSRRCTRNHSSSKRCTSR